MVRLDMHTGSANTVMVGQIVLEQASGIRCSVLSKSLVRGTLVMTWQHGGSGTHLKTSPLWGFKANFAPRSMRNAPAGLLDGSSGRLDSSRQSGLPPRRSCSSTCSTWKAGTQCHCVVIDGHEAVHSSAWGSRCTG